MRVSPINQFDGNTDESHNKRSPGQNDNKYRLKRKENKNTLETCKNPRPTSGWSELTVMHNINYEFPHGIFFMNSTNNARLKLSCKFGESKRNPC